MTKLEQLKAMKNGENPVVNTPQVTNTTNVNTQGDMSKLEQLKAIKSGQTIQSTQPVQQIVEQQPIVQQQVSQPVQVKAKPVVPNNSLSGNLNPFSNFRQEIAPQFKNFVDTEGQNIKQAINVKNQIMANTDLSSMSDKQLLDKLNSYNNISNKSVSNDPVNSRASSMIADEYQNELKSRSTPLSIAVDTIKMTGQGALSGTANAINYGKAATDKISGNDATSINAEQLYNYVNKDKKWYENVVDAGKTGLKNAANLIIPGANLIDKTTGYLDTPETSLSKLEKLQKNNPDNEKLNNLLNDIKNRTYSGSVQDLNKELDTIQKELYQGFKDKYTQDDIDKFNEMATMNQAKNDKNAWIANTGGTIGNMVPSMLVGAATGGLGATAGTIGSMTTLGLGAAGGAMEEALNDGANYNQAFGYGAASGAVEAGTELIGGERVNKILTGGNAGRSLLGKIFGKTFGNIENKFAKVALSVASDVAGEMTEEMISEAVNPLLKYATYKAEDGKGILESNNMTPSEYIKGIFQAGIEAIPSTLVMGAGGQVVMNRQINSYRDGLIKTINQNADLSANEKAEMIKAVKEYASEAKAGMDENFTKIQQDIMQQQVQQTTTQNTTQDTTKNVPQSSTTQVNNAEQQDTTPQVQNQNTDNVVQNGNKINSKQGLFDVKDFREVGNKNVNAYQYENPEVKPYFQEYAKYMLNDLNDSIRGERIATQDEYGDMHFDGTKRYTTSDIEDLLDGNYDGPKMSYQDIKDGLNGIIQDEGKENNAKSKRMELILDERLRNGYTDINGFQMEANQNYLDTIDGKQVETSNSISNDSDLFNLKPLQNKINTNTKNSNEQGSFSMNKNNNSINRELYHQTSSESLADMDISKRKAGLSDTTMPEGIFLKEHDNDIGLEGKNQLKLNTKIDNPLVVDNRNELLRILKKDEKYTRLRNEANNFEKQYSEIAEEMSINAQTKEELDNVEKYINENRQKLNEMAKEIQRESKEYLKSQGYDGVIINEDQGSFGRKEKSYIVFDKGQLTENNVSSNSDVLKSAYIPKDKKSTNYKTNLERESGLVEQKIQSIERGETARAEVTNNTSKSEIRKTIESVLGKQMLTKGFRHKAYGIYKPSTDFVRLAQKSDFETAIHELGHQIDIKKLNDASQTLDLDTKHELISICNDAFPGAYTNQSVMQREGFAEATKQFVIDPQEFAKNYPSTSYLIMNELENNPQLAKAFETLQEQVHDYVNMKPKDRVLSNVSINDENGKPIIDLKNIKQNFQKLFLDDNIALRNAVEKIAEAKGKKISELSAKENALLLMKLQEGSQDATLTSLSEGYRDANGNKVTKGLSEIVEGFNNEDINNLISYMVSEGNLDYINADKQTGIRENDAQAVLDEFKDTKIAKASEEIRKINNYSLNRLLEAGMITKEQIDTMKAVNEHYVPMNRVINDDGSIKSSTGGNNMKVGNALKKRKGSDLTIINPLESTIVNNMRIDKQIQANESLKSLVKTMQKVGIAGDYFDTVTPPMAFGGTATLENFKKALEAQGVDTSNLDLSAVYNIYSPKLSDDKNMIMSYMEDGKRKYIQFTDKELYKAINNLNSKQMSQFEKILSKFNGTLRWGATTANIAFAIPNFIADSQLAYLNSDSTFIPVVDSMVGIVDTITGRSEKAQEFLKLIAPDYVQKKKEMYYKYKTSGASTEVNRSGLSRGDAQNLMEDVYGLDYKTLFGKDKSAIQKASELFNLTTLPSDISEEATRFRNFEKEYNLYKKQGMSEEEALKKAGYNARRITQDFSEAGSITRSINRLKPFTSARIGGVTQTVQNAMKNPQRYAKRLGIMVAFNAALYAASRMAMGDDGDKELEELQNQKKLDNYTFYAGDNNIITIKKIQGPVRAIINLTELAVDYSLNKIDSDGVKKRISNIFNDLKMDAAAISSPTDLVGQLATPVVENALNKDFYYGNELVPDNMKYLDNKDKYNENTTETSKLLGKLLNYPPIYIDNLIEGYLAGVGTQSLKVSDAVINTVRGDGNKPAETPISEKFVLSRFFANTNKNSQSVNDVYEEYDKLANDKEYGRLTPENEQKLENIENAKTDMSLINKEIRSIKVDESLNSKEKREQLDKFMELRTDTARYFLGKDVKNKENEKQIELFEYYPSNQSKISNLLDWNEKGEYAQIVKDSYALNLKELKKDKKYQEATEEEKASKEKSALNKAKETAKQEIISKNIDNYIKEYGEKGTSELILDSDVKKNYEKAQAQGISLVDFYNAYNAKKDAQGTKNYKGETISGTLKNNQIKAVNNAVGDNLTAQQKKALYGIFNISGY